MQGNQDNSQAQEKQKCSDSARGNPVRGTGNQAPSIHINYPSPLIEYSPTYSIIILIPTSTSIMPMMMTSSPRPPGKSPQEKERTQEKKRSPHCATFLKS